MNFFFLSTPLDFPFLSCSHKEKRILISIETIAKTKAFKGNKNVFFTKNNVEIQIQFTLQSPNVETRPIFADHAYITCWQKKLD